MKIEELQTIAFQIIANAGEAKSLLVEAIDAAESKDFEKADELMERANKAIGECGKLHLPVVTAEAQKENLDFSVIFMHAEDQYLTTQLLQTIAEKFVRLYKKS